MSILRRSTRTQNRTFIVKPVGDFHPVDWQDVPELYKILERVPASDRIGETQALKFAINFKAIQDGTVFVSWVVTL